MIFEIIVGATAMIAGAIAAIAGLGIGSILTPLLASECGMKTAVGAVAVPHVIATIRVNERRGRAGWSTRACARAIAGALGLTGYADRLRFG